MNRRPPRRIDWWRVLGCALVCVSGIVLAVLLWAAASAAIIVLGQ